MDDIHAYLKQLPDSQVFVAGRGISLAGRAGGRTMANDLIADLEDEDEMSVSNLQKMILGEG